MTRRNERVRVRTTGITAGTGVYAPSTVAVDDTATRQAAALQRALGVGVDALDQHVQRRQDKGFAEGTLAAESGSVTEASLAERGTPENQKAAAWVLGAERVLARTRAIEDESAVLAKYEAEVDKTMPLPDLREWLNQQFSAAYADADPGIAREAAPFLKRAADNIMATHGTNQAAEAKQTVANGLSVNVMEWAARPTRTQEEWDEFRSQANLLGPTEGLTTLAMALGNRAVTAGDEAILDDPMFALLRTNPKTKPILDAAYHDATTLRLRGLEAAETYDRAALFTDFMNRAEAKDESLFADLRVMTTPDADGRMPIEQGQAQSIMNAFFNKSTAEVLTPAMVQQWADGTFGVYGESKWEDEAAQTAIARHAELFGQPAAVAFAVERSVANRGMPPFIKQLISGAEPTNATTWPQAVEWYSAFRAQQPEFLEAELEEGDKRRMETYLILAEDLGHEGAVERLQTYDPKLVQSVTRDERDEAMSTITETITALPWSWSTVEETPALRRTLDRNFDHMIALGYPPERAAEFAVERTQRSTIVVDGRLFPANAGFGQDPQAVVAQMKIDYAKAHGYEDGDIEVVPVPGQPNQAYVRSLNSPVSERVNLREASTRYEVVQTEQRLAATAEADAAKRAAYEEKAKQSLWPRMHEDPFALSNREAMWARLTPAEQRAAIEQVARHEDLAARERAERAERAQQANEARRQLLDSQRPPLNR